MPTNDGSDGFQGENIPGSVLDQVVLWHGDTLPGAGNDVPQGGLFLLEVQDGSNAPGIYEQTNAIKSTPTWVLKIALRDTLELLDSHEASTTESSHTFTPSSALLGAEYSEILIIITGDPSASFNLEAKINALTTAYYGDGYRITVGAETLIDNNNLAHWVICSSTLISGGNTSFSVRLRIFLPDADQGRRRIHASSEALSEVVAHEVLGHNITTPDVDSITDIIIETSTSTWEAGTKIDIYGIRRIS